MSLPKKKKKDYWPKILNLCRMMSRTPLPNARGSRRFRVQDGFSIALLPWYARKKNRLPNTAEKIILKIYNSKTKVMKIHTKLERTHHVRRCKYWRSPRFCVSRKQNHYRWGLHGWFLGSYFKTTGAYAALRNSGDQLRSA